VAESEVPEAIQVLSPTPTANTVRDAQGQQRDKKQALAASLMLSVHANRITTNVTSPVTCSKTVNHTMVGGVSMNIPVFSSSPFQASASPVLGRAAEVYRNIQIRSRSSGT
jgi:hypothetical protein